MGWVPAVKERAGAMRFVWQGASWSSRPDVDLAAFQENVANVPALDDAACLLVRSVIESVIERHTFRPGPFYIQ